MTHQENYYAHLFERYVPSPVNQKEEPEQLLPKAPANAPKRPRGFAAMPAEKQRQIASQGGTAAHQKGTAHRFNSEEARLAGRKGGESVSQDRRHMSEIGRKGGQKKTLSGKTDNKSTGFATKESSLIPESTDSP